MITAIVLAAGNGSRMQSSVKKQYMMLLGKPLVCYSLKAFNDCEDVDRIIVVTGDEDINYMRDNIVEKFNLNKVTEVVAGGKERYNSVYNGLQYAKTSNYILVHDGARPCITSENISRIIEQVKLHSACVAGVPAKDTIKIIDSNNNIVETPDRNTLWLAQTPQAFKSDILIKAYDEMMRAGDNSVTDDSMVVEKYCSINVIMVECSYNNIKVTTPEDIAVAERFLLE